MTENAKILKEILLSDDEPLSTDDMTTMIDEELSKNPDEIDGELVDELLDKLSEEITMKYKERLTRRLDCDYLFYISYEKDVDVLAFLGLYEDTGLNPLELAEMLIQAELSKPISERDMDRVEKWLSVKSNYYKYIQQKNEIGYDSLSSE